MLGEFCGKEDFRRRRRYAPYTFFYHDGLSPLLVFYIQLQI